MSFCRDQTRRRQPIMERLRLLPRRVLRPKPVTNKRKQHYRVIDAQRMTDKDVEAVDRFRTNSILSQDAKFRGAMLDALEQGRERLPTVQDYCDEDRSR